MVAFQLTSISLRFVPFELNPKTLPAGKPAMVFEPYDVGLWRGDLEKAFFAYLEEKNLTGGLSSFGIPKLHHTSGGITRVRALLYMLRQGMCDRLDLYGFSAGGGKYFEPRSRVSGAHVMGAENYFYRLIMATGVKGKFCVYGK